MTITIGALRNLPLPAGYAGPGAAQGAGTSDFQRALEQFKETAFQAPAERARDEVLKRNGLDERSYAELSAERRRTIDQEIAEAVQAVSGVPTRKDAARLA